MAYVSFSPVGTLGRPLAEKLGYTPGATIVFVALPDELAELPASAEFGKVARRQDWSRPLGPAPFDLVHAFTTSRAELAAGLPRMRRGIQPEGAIWVSWPKPSSGVATDLNEEAVRAIAHDFGMVDVKVAAIDHVWSGLKLVNRLGHR